MQRPDFEQWARDQPARTQSLDGALSGNRAEADKISALHIEIPAQQKARWVKAAQRANMSLAPWVAQALDEAAQKGRP